MLTDHQWSPVTFILGQFQKRCLNHQSLKSENYISKISCKFPRGQWVKTITLPRAYFMGYTHTGIVCHLQISGTLLVLYYIVDAGVPIYACNADPCLRTWIVISNGNVDCVLYFWEQLWFHVQLLNKTIWNVESSAVILAQLVWRQAYSFYKVAESGHITIVFWRTLLESLTPVGPFGSHKWCI